MATLNMGNSNVIGVSYSEMNKMKSNLKRSQQMLETSQRNVSTARVQLQVDRGRLRVTEDSLSNIYSEESKRKSKIDKMCSNIDYTIRRFKEVDSRCAKSIKSIGNSYNTKTSLFDKIKNVMISLGRYLFGGGTSLLNEGQNAFNNLGTNASNGFEYFGGIIQEQVSSIANNSKSQTPSFPFYEQGKISFANLSGDGNKIFSEEEARKYISSTIFGFSIGKKVYYDPEIIKNLPKKITYKKNGITYTYALSEYVQNFNGMPLSNSSLYESLSKSLGEEIANRISPIQYEYKEIYNDELEILKNTIGTDQDIELKYGIILFGVESTDFEKLISKMSPNDRVAAVKTKAKEICNEKGFIKDSKLSKINGRDVYRDTSTGSLYAVDSQHGRFEMLNKKGKHLGEVNFDFQQTKPADNSGGHNLKMK